LNARAAAAFKYAHFTGVETLAILPCFEIPAAAAFKYAHFTGVETLAILPCFEISP
jgi:hypothetical protein